MNRGRNVFIDSLKGVAILSVVFYHLGLFKLGYLGVDLFFGIAGYLTTSSLLKQYEESGFSYARYIFKKVFRICPLLFAVTLISEFIGSITMLPDDLENLSESVVASNLFLNNVLQCITTKNYWDVANDYKPLLHTWYLGVLMQFYILYPFVFFKTLKLCKNNQKRVMVCLGVITAVSGCLYLTGGSAERFYYLPYRFFEFGIGSIFAMLCMGRDNIMDCVLIEIPGVNILSAIGMASFSVYLCHQPIIAFIRYVWTSSITFGIVVVFICVTSLISFGCYVLFEKRGCLFSRKRIVSRIATVSSFAIGTISSLVIYFNAGVVQDVPELEVSVKCAQRGQHSKYNGRVYAIKKQFSNTGKTKVLCIGDSFARDMVNVFLESSLSNRIEIAYVYSGLFPDNFDFVANDADYIIYAGADYSKDFPRQVQKFTNDRKFYVVGNKRFGESNGIIYNRRWLKNYHELTADIPVWLVRQNDNLKAKYGDRYIDMMGVVRKGENKASVFTDENLFISQDCRHLTRGGARYFAKKLDLSFIKF